MDVVIKQSAHPHSWANGGTNRRRHVRALVCTYQRSGPNGRAHADPDRSSTWRRLVSYCICAVVIVVILYVHVPISISMRMCICMHVCILSDVWLIQLPILVDDGGAGGKLLTLTCLKWLLTVLIFPLFFTFYVHFALFRKLSQICRSSLEFGSFYQFCGLVWFDRFFYCRRLGR
jgi:hypothetical protein